MKKISIIMMIFIFVLSGCGQGNVNSINTNYNKNNDNAKNQESTTNNEDVENQESTTNNEDVENQNNNGSNMATSVSSDGKNIDTCQGAANRVRNDSQLLDSGYSNIKFDVYYAYNSSKENPSAYYVFPNNNDKINWGYTVEKDGSYTRSKVFGPNGDFCLSEK